MGIKRCGRYRLTDLDFEYEVAIISVNNGSLQQATTNLAKKLRRVDYD